MKITRRAWLATTLGATVWAAGCVATTALPNAQSDVSLHRAQLAPSGKLKIGVYMGSSSQGVLTREFKQAVVVPQPSIPVATSKIQQGQLDAFATNKAILFAMQDTLPGARILDGRWGLEHMAIAIPKGRESSLPYLNSFAKTVKSNGQLKEIIDRSGLKGSI